MKKVTVAKGVRIPQGRISKIRSKLGSSNAGKYKNVKPSDFIDQKAELHPIPIQLTRSNVLKLQNHMLVMPLIPKGLSKQQIKR